MNVDQVKAAVKRISNHADDAESAHTLEDELWARVLVHIAAHGDESSSMLASAALETRLIEFPRWCA